MRREGHLSTARQLEDSARVLAAEPDRHVKAITELLFGAAHHYIAAGLEEKFKEHDDKHSRDSGLLRKFEEEEIAERFEALDRLRAGRFYGKKGNGEIVAQAFDLIWEIKKWAK